MPHQCTACGHVFEDGSKEMLSGCPECGGTKFQFHPEGADISEQPSGDAEPPDRPDAEEGVAGTVGSAAATVRNLVGGGDSPPTGGDSALAETETAASGGTDSPSEENIAGVALNDQSNDTASPEMGASPDSPTGAESSPDSPTGAESSPDSPTGAESSPDSPTGEDTAQASARSDIVSSEELPDADSTPPPVEDGTVVEEPDDDRPGLSELREELNDQFESIKVVEPGQYELNLMELYDREEYIIALQEDGKYSIQVPDRWQD